MELILAIHRKQDRTARRKQPGRRYKEISPARDSGSGARSGIGQPPQCLGCPTQALKRPATGALPTADESSRWRVSCPASEPGWCGRRCNASSTAIHHVTRLALAVRRHQRNFLTIRTARAVSISEACPSPVNVGTRPSIGIDPVWVPRSCNLLLCATTYVCPLLTQPPDPYGSFHTQRSFPDIRSGSALAVYVRDGFNFHFQPRIHQRTHFH